MRTFEHRSEFDQPLAELFAWHERPGALERLVPPWQHADEMTRAGSVADGGRVSYRLAEGLQAYRCEVQYSHYVKDRRFVETQASGRFAHWRRRATFEPLDSQRSALHDHIEYQYSGLSALQTSAATQRQLERLFRWRHQRARLDLRRHAQHRSQPRMRIAVSGASGLLGGNLCAYLSSAGHTVLRLVRARAGKPPLAEAVESGTATDSRSVTAGASHGQISWDPATGRVDADALEAVDAVVHLAGENVAAGRWTAARKAAIRDSRVRGTALLCETLAKLRMPPRVLLTASAVGYYGARGGEPLSEDAAAGDDFLARVCREWELAADAARQVGIRVVTLRIGVVLAAKGGALQKMLAPFRAGLGGVIGSGQQVLSWIALDDLLGAIEHALHCDALRGPVNTAAPNAVTNREFTLALGRALRRPTIAPLPSWAVSLLFGEMGRDVLLTGQRAVPTQLLKSGFQFAFSDLTAALGWELGRAEYA